MMPSRQDVEADMARKRERASQSGLESILTDVVALVVFASLALGFIACCGPTAPRASDRFEGCKIVQQGRDIDAATNDTTNWSDYKCPGGAEWRRFSDSTYYRIK